MRWSLTAKISAGGGAALLLLVGIGVVSYQTTTRLVETSGLVARTHQVLRKLEYLPSRLKDAQGGVRGYVITGQDNYLEPYRAAVKTVRGEITLLRELTANAPAQQRRLDRVEPLIGRFLEVQARNISIRRDRGFSAVVKAIREGEGKRLLDEILVIITEMENDETVHLGERQRLANATTTTTRLFIISGSLLACILVGLALLFIRRLLEARTRAEEVRLKLASIEASSDAVIGMTLEGIIVNWNRGAERIYGYSAEEMSGRSISILASPDRPDEDLALLERIKQGGVVDDHQAVRERKDGAQLHISLTISPIKDASGEMTGASSIGRDITERKRAEEAIRTLNEELEQRVIERTAELEAFSYSISHDLRAPLRAIDGFSRLVVEEYGDHLDAEGQRLLATIRKNTKTMEHLIDDLLAFSHLGRKTPQQSIVDMTALARSVVEELRQALDRPVEVTIEPLASALADSTMIRQVFTNLIANAFKFTRHQPHPAVTIACRRDGRAHIYSVEDNGVGFDMQYAHKLFGVFQRLHSQEEFEGTGVGLALVQRIVQRHGGRVWAEGKVNEGATIYFTITRGGIGPDG